MHRVLPMDIEFGPTMAYDRKTFKSRMLGVLSGALTHYYMIELAANNKQTKWVDHWSSELERLINLDLVTIVVTAIKGRWDKRKAVSETLADLASEDRSYRRIAANYVAKVYRLKKLDRQLPADVQDAFYAMVEESVARALAAQDLED